MKTILVDLDGTLADIRHRLHYIKCDSPDWDEFYGAMFHDSVNKWCADLMHTMQRAGYKVVIVSARPLDTLEQTESWLYIKNISYDGIALLRKDQKDFTPDVELKRNWLKAFGKENVQFVIDDRQRVVDMWREEGVTCLQCNAWEEGGEKPREMSIPDLAKSRGYWVKNIDIQRPFGGNVRFMHPNAEEKTRKYLLRQPKTGRKK